MEFFSSFLWISAGADHLIIYQNDGNFDMFLILILSILDKHAFQRQAFDHKRKGFEGSRFKNGCDQKKNAVTQK